MSTTLIISSYQSPRVLGLTLLGYTCQSVMPEEILVADDGSDASVAAVVASYGDRLPLRMLTQRHEGFGKCAILNRAIEEASGDYLIFSDQDCIPRRDFVATHLAARREGRFVSGGYYRLCQRVCERLTEAEVTGQTLFSLRHLRELGQPAGKSDMKLVEQAWVRRLWDALTPAAASWNGCNVSAWRRDVVAAGGYDERMVYGGEDRELGERLENAGVTGMQWRHRAVLLHQWHERPYKTPHGLDRNAEIRAETRRLKAVFTPYGIKRCV